MRVSLWTLHLAIFLAFVAESRGFLMEMKCKLWAGNGYIGDPSDCQAWGFCQDNKLIERRGCNEGLLYNFRKGTCEKAADVMCHSNLAEICANLQLGGYAADPANCRRFVKCDDIDDPIWRDCGDDQVFSNKLQSCVQETSGCPQDNICSYIKDGSFVGDLNSCQSYYKCHNGFATEMNCSAGRYFNRKSGNCQSWLPEYCSKDDEIAPETPLSTNFHICSKYYQKDLSGVQLLPDLKTCYGYYACTSELDLGRWSSCPWGQHFEWWSQRCGEPKDNSCSYDRCGNINQLMVTTINTGCREYTVCQDYRSKRSEKCPEEFPYFNEISQRCTDKFPNHRVCYMDG
ncbi:peritrophin-44 [Drosophila subpulchrella]|uniref:peritrophin-44 n=1 Tax=Drosophila subpulchrella TaxID=1486046 RepID=UPI0018A1B431|nr:peritrophin-44 [Drosophila subpulchrella]